MRVTNSPVQPNDASKTRQTGQAKGAPGTSDAKPSEKAAATPRVDTSDSVKADISTRAKDMSKDMATAKLSAAAAPDVRPDKEEKIAELKRRIAGGTYNVDANAVADRMVDDHLATMKAIGG